MDSYFYDGKIVKIVGNAVKLEAKDVIVKVYKNLAAMDSYGAIYAVDMDELQQIASDKFNIGDKVTNVFKRHEDFTGTVVAFEEVTNRVICTSDAKDASSRTRYAYKVDSLELYVENKTIELKPGMRCLWNGYKGHPCLIVEHPSTFKEVLIVSHYGKIVKMLPVECTEECLRIFGIHNLEVM